MSRSSLFQVAVSEVLISAKEMSDLSLKPKFSAGSPLDSPV